MKYVILGCMFWGVILAALLCLLPRSPLHAAGLSVAGKSGVLLWVTLAATVLLCVLPMGLSPIWNGEIPGHRNQYELTAEAFLDGHLYIGYDDVDPRLVEMENPYDPALREQAGVSCHWDHAFYNGHYYMYFGVVPVLLVFLPFRLITGASLTTYHATQLFAALFICGVFATFYELSRRFFKTMSLGLYLSLSVAFSLISTWFCSICPALYCTAISSGLCFGMWSLYFFIRAVWIEQDEKKSILLAFFGSLTGALAFGCRPPIALANVLVLPMLVVYLRNRRFTWKLAGRLLFAASPYIVVGVLLMVYNYARFDSPFEFGQSYQITLADQSQYGNILEQFSRIDLKDLVDNFFLAQPLLETFPYIQANGAMINFPILICGLLLLFWVKVPRALRKEQLLGTVILMILTPPLITLFDSLCTPFLWERYRSDIYWLLGLTAFILIGFFYRELSESKRRYFASLMSVLSVLTVFCCFLLWCNPIDLDYTSYFPEKLAAAQHVLSFGLK